MGMGGAVTGDGGHAQCETGGGDGDGGDAGMLGEVSGANTATSIHLCTLAQYSRLMHHL